MSILFVHENYFTTGHFSLQKYRMSKASCTCRIEIFQPSVTSFQSSVRASVSLIKISCSDTLPLSNERGINESGGTVWGEFHHSRTARLLVFSVAFWGSFSPCVCGCWFVFIQFSWFVAARMLLEFEICKVLTIVFNVIIFDTHFIFTLISVLSRWARGWGCLSLLKNNIHVVFKNVIYIPSLVWSILKLFFNKIS